MEISRRDAFDLVLIGIALACVYSYAVDPSGPQTAIGDVFAAVGSVNPIAYLVVVGAAGILFLAYGLLYLPRKQSR